MLKSKRLIYKITAISLVLFIASITIVSNVYANNTDIKFKSITIEDGLSQTSVEAIFQDSRGLMWFGTGDGLNKYDGYEMKFYKNKAEDKNSLTANYVDAIVEDSEGNIWIGTNNGLNKLNSYTDNITRYTKENSSLSNNNVWDIIIDSNGYIWSATEQGLNKYDSKTDTFTSYFDDSSESENWITSVIEGSEGVIWASSKNGLIKFNPITEKYTRYLNDESNGNSLSNNYVYRVYEDSFGTVWVGTSGGGLNKFDKTTEKFVKYEHNHDDETSVLSNNIKHIYEDSNNNLWIASTGGLSKYDYCTDNFINYTNKYYDEYSLVDNNVLRIYEDKSGLLWAGTQNGISIFNPNSKFKHIKRNPIEENSLSTNMVFGVVKDSDGDLWIGTDNGLNRIESRTGLVTNYYNNPEDENSLVSNSVKHVMEDSEGYIWIGTKNGLSKYDKKNEKFTNYKYDEKNENSLIYDYIRYIYEDSKGLIWIGTRRGLDVYDKNKDKFTHYKEDGLPGSLVDDYITAIYEDSDGVMWFGGGLEGGLFKFDREKETFKPYTVDDKNPKSISSNAVRSIIEDDEGYLWLGTRYGLNKFDKNKEEFIYYTEEDGLSNNFIYGILNDEEDNLWISTNKGISNFNIITEKFTNYYITDGLQSDEFNSGSFYKHKDGELFFGGINGVTHFYPKEIKSKIYVSKVNIKDFKIFGKSIEFKSKNEIVIPYKEDFFSVEFVLPDYKNPNMNQYAYMLKGLDEDWIYSGNRNYISYSNIKGGSYIFKVKGKSSNGLWSEIPTEIRINVEKPPWKRWWAYLIYISIIIMFIIFFINYVRILENAVRQRTKELQNKLDENDKLYNKVIKYEKFKNDFFVNLSHELRTPINIILSTLQLTDSFYEKGQYEKIATDYYKYSSIVRKNSVRLLKVVSNLIDTTKISGGQYNITPIKTDIIYLVEEVALSMKEYIEHEGLNFVFDTEIEEKEILCDPNEIERCIINLISNAVKFTQVGGTIWINMFDKGDNIEISVKDNGIGIPEDKKKYIFERFKQVDNAISSKKTGSGIGLSLVKSLVELHNGSIRVESEINKGSEFIISLPVKPSTKTIENKESNEVQVTNI